MLRGSGNQIEVIHPKIFEGVLNLQNIYFSRNQIKELHQDTFKELNNLEC